MEGGQGGGAEAAGGAAPVAGPEGQGATAAAAALGAREETRPEERAAPLQVASASTPTLH